MDIALEGQVDLEKHMQLILRVPVLARLQVSRAFYTGLGATADLGLTSERKKSVDLQAILGTSYQARGEARVDLEATFFVENMGSGAGQDFSDGGGAFVKLTFFPELY
jgi:hypothetical protein